MDKEKLKFYSIGRGSLNLDGKFYYGLDYAITDFMMDLEQQCKKQKEVIDRIKEYIQNHQLVFKDSTLEEIEEWFNQFYIDVLDILKEV